MSGYEIGLNGIILSSQPVGEFDRRLVILTGERGKIACFAKGARRPTSRLAGSTRVFAFGVFYVYEGRNSYNLHRADIKNYFEGIVKDSDATMYACYFAEIADYYGFEGLEAKEPVNLLYGALKALEDERLNRRTTAAVYAIRAVADAGECPAVEGLHLPAKCLDEDVMKTFSYILTAPVERLFKFTVGDSTTEALEMIADRVERYAIDKKLRSKEMLP